MSSPEQDSFDFDQEMQELHQDALQEMTEKNQHTVHVLIAGEIGEDQVALALNPSMYHGLNGTAVVDNPYHRQTLDEQLKALRITDMIGRDEKDNKVVTAYDVVGSAYTLEAEEHSDPKHEQPDSLRLIARVNPDIRPSSIEKEAEPAEPKVANKPRLVQLGQRALRAIQKPGSNYRILN